MLVFNVEIYPIYGVSFYAVLYVHVLYIQYNKFCLRGSCDCFKTQNIFNDMLTSFDCD